MKILAALPLLLLALPTRADVQFQRKIVQGAAKAENPDVKPREEVQTTWLGADRVRIDKPRASYLIRFDQKKLFILFPDKTYSAIDLPVDLARQVPADKQAEFEELRAKLTTTTSVTPTGEEATFREWKTHKFLLKMSSPSRSSDDVVWTTTDVQIDWDTYWNATSVILSLQPNGDRIATEMRRLQGITVQADRKITVDGNVFDVHEELLALERKPAPEGLYDVPAGYTLKTWDALPDLRGMAGGGKVRGGEAKPKEGEGKEPPKKREGGKGTEAKGGDEKKGGAEEKG